MNRCDGKIALVTGGARGLGAETAKRLAEAGASILLTDILDDEGRQTADAIADKGGKAHYMHHDVTSEEEWDAVVAEAKSRFGGLDILVNNAGIYYSKPIGETSMDDWRRMMSINVDGVFLGCRAALPLLRERAGKWRGGGSVVNLSSVAGIIGAANGTAYHASKGAVRLLTKSLALEGAEGEAKVRANSVHPAVIDTNMGRDLVGQMSDALGVSSNEGTALITMMHPLGRLGMPEDVANAVVYLSSDDSAFVTGAELIVDGGLTAR
ncbi:SDR family NAD(P)-dependent oxidoreductase [Pyruvatibacter mobilis]|uniref:SDR family NAD(P)-dependent oxidoreductase n=1 Tax=Pyruvatibacter mobilis TaxID=1712261 RepID=UPI003C7AEBCA